MSRSLSALILMVGLKENEIEKLRACLKVDDGFGLVSDMYILVARPIGMQRFAGLLGLGRPVK